MVDERSTGGRRRRKHRHGDPGGVLSQRSAGRLIPEDDADQRRRRRRRSRSRQNQLELVPSSSSSSLRNVVSARRGSHRHPSALAQQHRSSLVKTLPPGDIQDNSSARKRRHGVSVAFEGTVPEGTNQNQFGINDRAGTQGRSLRSHKSLMDFSSRGSSKAPRGPSASDTKMDLDLFVTILYGYLVNRTLEDSFVDDVQAIFKEHLRCDIRIGKHVVRHECILKNWCNFVFRNPPGMNNERDTESPAFLSTLLYVSKTKGVECDYPNCACKTTQGHLRWTKSMMGHQLEVFTFDWNHSEIEATFQPIGFE